MEKIEVTNNRQIPKTKEICGNKKYMDMVYGYLQRESEPFVVDTPEGKYVNYRYVMKKDINYVAIGKTLGISRQTVSKKIKDLVELGLLEETKDRYKMVKMKPTEALLIPKVTLEVFDSVLKDHAISVYVYFFNRFFANGFKPFVFRLDQVKDHIGMSPTNKATNNVITIIMGSLKDQGLIDFDMTYVPLSDTNRVKNLGDARAIYQIKDVFAAVQFNADKTTQKVSIRYLKTSKEKKAS